MSKFQSTSGDLAQFRIPNALFTNQTSVADAVGSNNASNNETATKVNGMEARLDHLDAKLNHAIGLFMQVIEYMKKLHEAQPSRATQDRHSASVASRDISKRFNSLKGKKGVKGHHRVLALIKEHMQLLPKEQDTAKQIKSKQVQICKQLASTCSKTYENNLNPKEAKKRRRLELEESDDDDGYDDSYDKEECIENVDTSVDNNSGFFSHVVSDDTAETKDRK
ncbi:hypothetical protein MBANPS3_011366 [Mucor bainieri]